MLVYFIYFWGAIIFSLVVSTALGIAFNFLCFGFLFLMELVRHAFIRHVLAYLFIMTTNAILLWFWIESTGLGSISGSAIVHTSRSCYWLACE